ncbi:MAG: trypsin-like serine protease, partial [Pseudomonadota bacterium]
MARLMQACVWIGLFALQCGNASAIVIDAVRDPVSAIVPNLTTDQFAGVGSVNGGCTGTVIGRQTVLTAAHCFAPGVTRSQFRLPFDDTPDVFASGDVITFPGYDRTIPSFDQTQTPDLAILSLDNQLPDFIPQYRLADFETNPSQIAIELVGFGNTGTGLTGQVPGTNSSTTKRFGLNDVDLFEANGNYFTGDFDPSFSNLNILGTQGTGILEVIPGQGDSGGPAFYNPKTSLDIALERADINSFSGDVLDELFV